MIDFIDAYDDKWDIYIKRMDKDLLDIYYTKEYCRLYEGKNSKVYLFVFEEENNIGLYPVLLTQINIKAYEEYFDIETPYGYGGPVIKYDDESFKIQFEKEFNKFCLEKKIIAEFIRFHPLICNENLFRNNIFIIKNRTTVYVDLRKSIKEIWENHIDSKNRNVIRKAEKNGLVVEESKDYKEFINIYATTMERVDADSYYYFDEVYYEELFNNENVKLFVVKFEEKIIAAAIFLKFNKFFHYHLAGSLKEYLKYSPNNLLLWKAMNYGKEQGCDFFHLGGGLTNSLEDNLYKFKKKFSKDIRDFYIGKRVHNLSIYKQLIDIWEKQNNKKASILLQYKLINDSAD